MTFNWLNPKAQTNKSVIADSGTLVIKTIHKMETVAIWGGHIMTKKEADQLPEKLQGLLITVDDGLYMGPKNQAEACDGDFVNHSCDPNCGLMGLNMLVALRDIKPGEEITFDYGTCVVEPGWAMDCDCGSKNCRRKITSKDWQDPKFQAKYGVFLSPCVQKKITAAHNSWDALAGKIAC